MDDKPSSKPQTQADEPAAEAPKGKRCCGCGTIILVLLGGFCITAGVLFWLVRSEPAHWKQREAFIESHTEVELLEMAESVEQRLLASFAGTAEPVSGAGSAGSGDARGAGSEGGPRSADGGGEGGEGGSANAPAVVTREVKMSINEVNAWMNQRLDGWMRNQGKQMPDGVRKPMLAVDGNRLVLAFKYQKGSVSQVVSLKFKVMLTEGSDAVMRLDGVQAGKLSLPGGAMKKLGRAAGESSQDKIKKLAQAFDGMQFNPVLDLDGQKVRLVEMKMDSGGLNLVVRSGSEG